jgi:hypothetical protein
MIGPWCGAMTVYEETVAAVRAISERARTSEDVLFCERRPLTSLEAGYAGEERLASGLRELEDEAIGALQRLADAEQGYESALGAIEDAGPQASEWLRAVLLARAIETAGASA